MWSAGHANVFITGNSVEKKRTETLYQGFSPLALTVSIVQEQENREYSRGVQSAAIQLRAQIQQRVLASVINTKMVKMDRQVPSVMISPASS